MKRHRFVGDEEPVQPLTTDEQQEIVAEFQKEHGESTNLYRKVIFLMCFVLGTLKICILIAYLNDSWQNLSEEEYSETMEILSAISFFCDAAFILDWNRKWWVFFLSLLFSFVNLMIIATFPSPSLFFTGWHVGANALVAFLCYSFDSITQETKSKIKSLEGYIYNLKSV
mmetsp:Transcript_1955/g.2643  ORF Transcript_1955/g.2643 Transcript_1955/m.2643 type:complete len:170 (+) Transcript_1955:1108-1617(+)